MKKIIILIILFFFIYMPVYAKKGCCSGYGGVLEGQCYDGHLVCNYTDENGDNYVSPSCECENDTTYYYEDAANGDLLYETTDDEEFDDDDDDYDSYDEDDNVEKDDSSDYLGVGAVLVAIVGGSYAMGKSSKKRLL